jgi:hypothetical protein
VEREETIISVTNWEGVIGAWASLTTLSPHGGLCEEEEGEGEGASIFQSTDNHLRIDNKMEFPSETRPTCSQSRWRRRYPDS